MHHAEDRNTIAQQRHGNRRTAPAFQEFAGPVLRIDEPEMARVRSGRRARLLAEKVAGNERLQPCAQARFDLVVDRCLAACPARTARTSELLAQLRAFLFDESGNLREEARRIQRFSACVPAGKRAAPTAQPGARPDGGN